MADAPSSSQKSSIIAPASNAVAITPNDAVDLPVPYTRSIYIGGAGTLKVDMLNSGTVTFSGLLAGTTLSIQAKRVYATGTSATLLIQLY